MAKSVRVLHKGLMKPEDSLRIQRNSMYIEREVDGRDLAPTLFQDEIIDGDDKERVETGKTSKDRIRTLLAILERRGPNAYRGFLKALRGNGYIHVADALEGETKTPGQSKGEDVVGRIKRLEEVTDNHKEKIDNLEKSVYLENPNYEELSQQIKEYEKALKTKKDVIESIQQELKQKNEELQQLRDDFKDQKLKLNCEIEDLKRQLEETTTELDQFRNLHSRIESLALDHKKTTSRLDKMDSDLQKFMRNSPRGRLPANPGPPRSINKPPWKEPRKQNNFF